MGWEKATFTKAYAEVTEDNYRLLGLLDALKDFKQIPDLDKNSAIIILSNQLKSLNAVQVDLLIKYALKYPRVRAFLGALLEKNGTKDKLNVLKESLNPFSAYNYGIGKILSNTQNWNIK